MTAIFNLQPPIDCFLRSGEYFCEIRIRTFIFYFFLTCMKNAKYSSQVQANFYLQQKMSGTSEKRLNKILERGEKFQMISANCNASLFYTGHKRSIASQEHFNYEVSFQIGQPNEIINNEKTKSKYN